MTQESDLLLAQVKVGDKLRCIRGKESALLKEGVIWVVAVVVYVGQDWLSHVQGNAEGVILIPQQVEWEGQMVLPGYPYVWNVDRFEKV